jgi:hypothetical protein
MLGLRKNRAPPSRAVHSPGREAPFVYDGHAVGLYRQALLTLGDADLAEQVVMCVIVDECLQPGAPSTAAARLAVSVYWRCQDLARNGDGGTGPALSSSPALRAMRPSGP